MWKFNQGRNWAPPKSANIQVGGKKQKVGLEIPQRMGKILTPGLFGNLAKTRVTPGRKEIKWKIVEVPNNKVEENGFTIWVYLDSHNTGTILATFCVQLPNGGEGEE